MRKLAVWFLMVGTVGCGALGEHERSEQQSPSASALPDDTDLPYVYQNTGLRTDPVANPAPPGTTYRVQRGDTLTIISRKHYGTSNGWKNIYDHNRDVLTNPNRLHPGMTLRIP